MRFQPLGSGRKKVLGTESQHDLARGTCMQRQAGAHAPEGQTRTSSGHSLHQQDLLPVQDEQVHHVVGDEEDVLHERGSHFRNVLLCRGQQAKAPDPLAHTVFAVQLFQTAPRHQFAGKAVRSGHRQAGTPGHGA
jgi:hypothetical protein